MPTDFNDNFKSLQNEFEQINQAYSSNMSQISEGIRFNSVDTDEIKEQLIEFAAEQERIANYQSLSERFLRRASKLPLLGNAAKSSAESMRKERLNEATVSGLVGTMYKGLQQQAKDVEETERRLVQIHETTTSNLATVEHLNSKIERLFDNTDIPATHKSRIMRMSTQVKVMAEKLRDKISTLELVIPSTQACLETIYRELPISEADLLSDVAMSTGVSQINALSQDVKEMRELSEIVSNSIYDKTQKSIINLLEMNSVNEKDIARIESNAKRRDELRLETVRVAQKSTQQLQLAHKKIEDVMQQSAERRKEEALMLEGTING